MSRSLSPLKDRLIFVVGARRSGTNWLQRIIGAHPDVVSVPSETYLFHTGLPQLVERFHHAAVGSGQTGSVYMDRDRMLDALRDFCDVVFEGLRSGSIPDAQRVVERTPDHVRHLGLIGDVYPDGRIVHIVRDGRDVARSLRSQPWGPDSVEEAADEWRTAIDAARSAAPQLQHYLEVRYEDLLADTPGLSRRIFEWLDLESTPASLEGALLEAGVRFNVDPSAPGVSAGKWRDAFSPEDLAAFDRVAGATLEDLGYGPSEAPRPPRRTARSRLGLMRRRSGRGATRAKRERNANAELRARQWQTQEVVNRFLDGVARGEWDHAGSMLADAVHVQIVEHGRSWQGRGSEARRRLVETLASDPALCGTQVRGDVHPGLPTWTVVSAYRVDDGSVLDRVWVLTTEGERIGRIGYYRLSSD